MLIDLLSLLLTCDPFAVHTYDISIFKNHFLFSRPPPQDVRRLLAHGVGAGHACDSDDHAHRGAGPREVRAVLPGDEGRARRARRVRRHRRGHRTGGGLHGVASAAY